MERFTTFEGRIGRQEWWIGMAILIAIAIGFTVVAGFIFGDGFFGRLIRLLFSIVMLMLFAGVSVRRLHDRNKPANPWLLIFCGPSLLYNVMNVLGIGFYWVEIAGQSFWLPGTLGWLVGLASMMAGVWALVELGVLKGSDGPNDFGPDPLR